MSLKGVGIGMLGIDHQHGRFEVVRPGADPAAFLAGAEPVEFAAQGRKDIYEWVERVLVWHEYARQGKAARGLLRRYVEKMTGLSRAQVTRFIAAYQATGRVRVTEYERHRFAARYTKADVELLAYVDKAHGNLSGPATRRILRARVRSAWHRGV